MEDYSSSTSFDLMIPSATLSIIIKFLSDRLLYIDYRKIKSLVVKCPTGDDEIMKIIYDYEPLIKRNSYINSKFDEDLNQNIQEKIYETLRKNRKIKKI